MASIIKLKFGVIFLAGLLAIPGGAGADDRIFHGASDVSAVAFLDKTHFAAADDETNYLRIYDIHAPEKPASTLDLNAFLEIEPDFPEADIEAAARMGDRIYWITSHGRNSDGKPRPNRYRFFSTKLKTGDDSLQLELVGQPCRTLIPQFLAQFSPIQDIIAKATRLDASLSKKERKKLAPKENGLNIEGLVEYLPHQSLLIGLRNPLFSPAGKKGGNAIVIELLNPQAVVDAGVAAQFGRVLYWNLGNRGIRAMHYSVRQKAYFIMGGAVDSETTFALYKWDGEFEHQPTLVYEMPKSDTFNPETMAEGPSDGWLWLFSDDGTREIPVDSADQCMAGKLLKNGRCPNKYLTDPLRKTFRVRPFNPADPLP